MPINVRPFQEYQRLGLSAIPCKRVWDEADRLYHAKVPAIKDWSAFCGELPDDDIIDSWGSIDEIFGLAVVTGEASNIACIDVDTEDPVLQQRIIEALPYTPLVVLGNPKRGGKFIYRLTDEPHKYRPLAHPKMKIADPLNPRKSAVDLFFGNAYICIPPSLHSDKNGEAIYYRWANEGMDFNTVPMDSLPVLDPAIYDKLRLIVEHGKTPMQMVGNLPSRIDLSSISPEGMEIQKGRWQTMVAMASRHINDRMGFEAAVDSLLAYDSFNHKDNMFFMDKTKGARTLSPRINAINFYSDMLKTINSKKGLGALEEPRMPVNSVAASTAPGTWGPIIPMLKGIDDVSFDTSIIPEPLRLTVLTASQATAVPPQSIFFYMLSTFSSLLGNKVIVQPYHMNREYTESSNLYVGLVAKSGERKTETTKIARKALMKIASEEKSRMQKIAKEGAHINENIEVRIAKVERDIKKEVEDNGVDSPYAEQLRKEIEDLQSKRVKIREISLYEQENTPEAMYGIVENNPNGIFIEINEWGSFYESLLTKEYKKLRRFIMDGWDGQNPFQYKTKKNGTNNIEKLCLSVGFSIQEDVMASIVWRICNLQRENDGLMQRFMLICSDNSNRPITDTNLQIGEELYSIFRNAYCIAPSNERVLLELDAYDAWLDFLNENKRKRKLESVPALESFMSKYDGMIIRIASNVAHINNDGKRVEKISLRDFKNARAIVDYLERSVRSLFTAGERRNLKEIVMQLEMGIIEDGAKVRDLYRHHQGLFGRTSEECMEKLKVLHNHNYIRVVKDTGGSSSYSIRINPDILKS